MTRKAKVPVSQNQRDMLENIAKKQAWEEAVAVYQDDGFTGLVIWSVPDLQRMLRAIERAGKINLVITKDISRLGRNHLQTGHFWIEDFFPKKRCPLYRT